MFIFAKNICFMWLMLILILIPFVFICRILWNLGTKFGNKDKR